jgi:hypothetical protein
MSKFNQKNFDTGRKGGPGPISSTPGQPADMHDRAAFWQGQAHARASQPFPSAPAYQPPKPRQQAPPSGNGPVPPLRPTPASGSFSSSGFHPSPEPSYADTYNPAGAFVRKAVRGILALVLLCAVIFLLSRLGTSIPESATQEPTAQQTSQPDEPAAPQASQPAVDDGFARSVDRMAAKQNEDELQRQQREEQKRQQMDELGRQLKQANDEIVKLKSASAAPDQPSGLSKDSTAPQGDSAPAAPQN